MQKILRPCCKTDSSRNKEAGHGYFQEGKRQQEDINQQVRQDQGKEKRHVQDTCNCSQRSKENRQGLCKIISSD